MMEKLSLVIKFILIMLFFSYASYADIRGYIIGQGIVTSPTLKNDNIYPGALRFQNINRINALLNNNVADFEFSFQVNQTFDHINDSLQYINYKDTPDRSYRIYDLNQTWLTSGDSTDDVYTLLPNLDRLRVTKYIDDWEVVAGRQVIALGSSKTVNPLDVLAPFSLTEVNTEERNGVDALRFRKPFGALGEIDIAAVFGKEFRSENSSYYISLRHAESSYEVSPIVMLLKDAQSFGIDSLFTFGGGNLTFESLYVNPLGNKDYLRFTTGYELQLPNEIILNLEYSFNGAGENAPQKIASLYDDFSYTDGGNFFTGRHYLNGYVSKQINALNNISTIFFWNLGDHSLLLSPLWELSVSDDLLFNIGGFLSLGERSRGLDQIQSEFGLYPQTIFIKVRRFF